ncbi:MAG TPA: hypothetical protein VMU93_12750 [Caulobacteraceae bacterium]|nr:hypothetical protein [Caulobacteraceae bacterium]
MRRTVIWVVALTAAFVLFTVAAGLWVAGTPHPPPAHRLLRAP